MALAFCILAHKLPSQVIRLVDVLDHPGALFVLHYDRKAPKAEHVMLREWARGRENVLMMRSRSVLWGRYSQIATQLEGIDYALHASREWSHVLTISGQDFPLRPGNQIADKFSGKEKFSFISYFDPIAEPVWSDVEDRIRRIHFDSPALERILAMPWIGRRVRQLLGWKDRLATCPVIRRSPPTFFKYFGGSNHVNISRSAAEYLLGGELSSRIRRWLRWTGFPEEATFQSVLLNSPLAGAVINDDRRFIEFPPRAANPRILTLADLPKLRRARGEGKLIARKFDITVDAQVLDLLHREIAAA